MNAMPCYCGHDCARCKVYVATVTGDEDLRAEAAAYNADAFGITVEPEALRCMGGRSGEIFCLCRDCPWMRCCREKGIGACADCAEYPCPPLADYIERYVNKVNQIP